jgi:hypothetical protein
MYNKNDTQLMAELNKEKIFSTLEDFKQELIGIEDVVAAQALEQLSPRGEGTLIANQEPKLRYRDERDKEKVQLQLQEENPRIEKDISVLERSLRGAKVFDVDKSTYNNNLIESKRLSMGSIMHHDSKCNTTVGGGTNFLPSVENIHTKFMGQSMINFSTANKLNNQVNSPLKISANNVFASNQTNSSNRYGSQEMNKSFLQT